MRPVFLVPLSLALGVSYVGLFGLADATPAPQQQTASSTTPTTADANRLLQRQPGFFVPNLGQWEHGARFIHRSGPMTVFVKDRGWVLDLVERPVVARPRPHAAHRANPGDRESDQKLLGVAVSMTFESEACVPEIVGENKLPGHHSYFLGNDESKWRTDVPLYSSVRYENLYPGIDLRLREMNGVPEYDLLLQPGADLSLVNVRVEGGQGLSIAKDGSLVIETALGPLTQSVPRTWEVGHDGASREVACNFALLGANRFGFAAPGWDGDTSLTIDPKLIWSTLLGGTGLDRPRAVSVDPGGIVTVAGFTLSTDFPTTLGAYDRTHSGGSHSIVCRFDRRMTGANQLIYSTFIGGKSNLDYANALSVDDRGVVTIAGYTGSSDFPTTSGAYDSTFNGQADVFVSRLDPGRKGAKQLVYSTLLGGLVGNDLAFGVSADGSGVITVAGYTDSKDFPTTSGAYDTTHNNHDDIFISRLDPGKTRTAQLVYSTFLGGSNTDRATALSVDDNGVVSITGYSGSGGIFPTTPGAYDRTFNGGAYDAIVSRLDPRKTGAAQLVYSTYLGGSGTNGEDYAQAIAVDANGVMTVTGWTLSSRFPTTANAYDGSHNGNFDGFVSRLDPSKSGVAQLVYSTYLGGSKSEYARALDVDVRGVVTVAGRTSSDDFPTTLGAYRTVRSGGSDAFVTRLDPRKSGPAQLVHGTLLGGRYSEYVWGLDVDPAGVVTVAGYTRLGSNFPTTIGAYDTTDNGSDDVFVSSLSMGASFHADGYELSLKQAGVQNLRLDAGKVHANRSYAIFGSGTGTVPGINLAGIHLPLNFDVYSEFTIGSATPPVYLNFKGTLDSNGEATASIRVPSGLPPLPAITLYHAYLVFDNNGIYMASDAVPLRLK
jgi:hypothetical protein